MELALPSGGDSSPSGNAGTVIEWGMASRRSVLFASGLALAAIGGSQVATRPGGWPTHGGNPAHTAISPVAAQDLSRILWSTPLDLAPQYNGDVLYAHYGSPVASTSNVVVIPVKTGATGGFRIEARTATTGALLWQQTTDYVTPSHNWFPTLGPTLTGKTAAYARKAGFVAFHSLDRASTESGSACFYGTANYNSNPAAYDAAVKISSPLVTADDGSVVFTYRVEGSNPLGLQGGLAVVRTDGTGAYVEGTVATGDANYFRPKLNAAPAIAGGVVYAVFKDGGNDGVLVGLNLASLKPLYKAALVDPKNGGPSYVDDDGTACPAIGPDGDVYFGVLENPFGSHHYRGWLLHFDRILTRTKTPGSFGWDDTPSIVPRSIVTAYGGASSYLVMTKYNNYAGPGDGVNKIALLDPNASATDPISGIPTMQEVMTQVGPTPDAGNVGSFPNAVREWCINSAAVDVLSHTVLVNNEDGYVYRWNLDANRLDEKMQITSGIGQAYTPVMLGSDGTVFAISNAKLFAIGGHGSPASIASRAIGSRSR